MMRLHQDMRTTVDIDPHLLRQLRAEAHRRGVPFREILTSVLQRGLERSEGRRGRYRCPTFSMGSPTSARRLDRALELAAALEDEDLERKLSRRR